MLSGPDLMATYCWSGTTPLHLQTRFIRRRYVFTYFRHVNFAHCQLMPSSTVVRCQGATLARRMQTEQREERNMPRPTVRGGHPGGRIPRLELGTPLATLRRAAQQAHELTGLPTYGRPGVEQVKQINTPQTSFTHDGQGRPSSGDQGKPPANVGIGYAAGTDKIRRLPTTTSA